MYLFDHIILSQLVQHCNGLSYEQLTNDGLTLVSDEQLLTMSSLMRWTGVITAVRHEF